MNDNAHVVYTPDELCSVLEALHDGIRDRFRWSISNPTGPWRSLDFEIARSSIDLLVQAYTKTMMVIQGWPTEVLDPEFIRTFMLPSEVWDLLAEITTAKDWDHVPQHEIEAQLKEDPKATTDCPVCAFAGVV